MLKLLGSSSRAKGMDPPVSPVPPDWLGRLRVDLPRVKTNHDWLFFPVEGADSHADEREGVDPEKEAAGKGDAVPQPRER